MLLSVNGATSFTKNSRYYIRPEEIKSIEVAKNNWDEKRIFITTYDDQMYQYPGSEQSLIDILEGENTNV